MPFPNASNIGQGLFQVVGIIAGIGSFVGVVIYSIGAIPYFIDGCAGAQKKSRRAIIATIPGSIRRVGKISFALLLLSITTGLLAAILHWLSP